MKSCRSTLIVDVYDVVPWQSPGGATFHDVNDAKLSWLAVCILAVILLWTDPTVNATAPSRHSYLRQLGLTQINLTD